MNILIIADSFGLGIIETRPHPVWQRKYTALRNKALLAPDYGAMYIAAYLKHLGIDFQVVNLVADLFTGVDEFADPDDSPEDSSPLDTAHYEEDSKPPIGTTRSLDRALCYFDEALRAASPDVVLLPLSIYNLARHGMILARRIKELLPGTIVVTGGVYASFHTETILEEGWTDYVVRGEGEETVHELLSALLRGESPGGIAGLSHRVDGRAFHNPDREKIEDLDRLPHPYTVSEEFKVRTRHRLLIGLNPEEDYIPGSGFLTARGCPEFCTFCLDPAINGGRTRFHSPEYVYDVAEYCYENFVDDNPDFYFGDATFTLNRKRLIRMARMLKKLPFTYHIQTRADRLTPDVIRTLKESGFHSVAIGAETLNERILREVVRKNQSPDEVLEASLAVREEGLLPLLTFIVGLPEESRESILRTLEILRENGITSASFFPLVVFKGTGLYERFVEERSPDEMESCRLNPFSEEFLYLSDEFPTRDSLIGFTEELNVLVKSP